MPPIRNSCVARGTSAAGTYSVVYTVPANTVLLLKSAEFRVLATGTHSIFLYLTNSGGGVSVAPVEIPSSTNDADHWSGWIALNAGDTITVYATGVGVYYWISGALLPFVPGF